MGYAACRRTFQLPRDVFEAYAHPVCGIASCRINYPPIPRQVIPKFTSAVRFCQDWLEKEPGRTFDPRHMSKQSRTWAFVCLDKNRDSHKTN